jgi:AAA domain
VAGAYDPLSPSEATEVIPDWLRPKPASALKAQLPKQIIKGVLYAGGKLMLAGGSKSYKTWIMLDLAYSIANGLPFLGMLTEKSKVFYADLELLEADCRSRIDVIRAAHGANSANDLDNLHVLNLRGKTGMINPARIQQISQIIREGGYQAFFIDPIYKLLAGRPENANEEITAVLQPFDKLTVETEAAFFYAHHFSKGNQASKSPLDRASGAGVWARDPDCIITLTEHEQDLAFTVDWRLRSFAPIPSFVANWEFPRLERDRSGLDPLELKAPLKPGRPRQSDSEQIMTALRVTDQEGGLPFSKLEKASQMKPTTFKRRLKELQAGGRIRQNPISKNWELSQREAERYAANGHYVHNGA